MAAVITIWDETPIGKPVRSFKLELASARISVRDILKRRIQEEVRQYNEELPGYFHGLVQPTDAESTLNGYRMRQRKQIDWEDQYQKALKAFENNGFFLLVDDRQVEKLDDEFAVTADTRISFVKLVPLVGG